MLPLQLVLDPPGPKFAFPSQLKNPSLVFISDPLRRGILRPSALIFQAV